MFDHILTCHFPSTTIQYHTILTNDKCYRNNQCQRQKCLLNDTCFPDSKVHEANMGPTWVLSAPGRPHVGPMSLVSRVPSSTLGCIVGSHILLIDFSFHFTLWKRTVSSWRYVPEMGTGPGAGPTNAISIEFEIWLKSAKFLSDRPNAQ